MKPATLAVHRPVDTRSEADALAQIAASLERLVDGQSRMIAVLERLAPAARLTAADHRVLTQLLPRLAATFGEQPFTVRAVLDHADSALVRMVAGRSAKSLGRLLMRAQGVTVDGHFVGRRGQDRGAAVWVVFSMSSVSRLFGGFKPA